MKHCLFNLLAGLSLLLGLMTAAMWVRSYWNADSIGKKAAYESITAISENGRLGLEHYTLDSDVLGHPTHDWIIDHNAVSIFPEPVMGPGIRRNWKLMGFWWVQRDKASLKSGYTITVWWASWEIGVPYTAVVVLLLILPVLAFRRSLLNPIRGSEVCSKCGYDLRATPDRCPECGTVTAKSLISR